MTLLADLRFAHVAEVSRSATAAVITLALGAGVNAAIFTVIYAVMPKPLRYAQPDRLVQVW